MHHTCRSYALRLRAVNPKVPRIARLSVASNRLSGWLWWMSLIAAILVSPLRAIRSAEARPSQRTLVLCVSLTPDVAESTLDVLRKLEGVGANADCEVAALIDAGGAVYAGINAELPRVADRMALRLAGGRWRRDPRFPEGLGGIGEPGVVAGYLARVSTSHDSVILALKGHGERNRGVLAAGTDEWITPRRLRDEIRDSNVHVDGLLLDCCFGNSCRFL